LGGRAVVGHLACLAIEVDIHGRKA
jgi:hypothetical protein